MASLRVHPDRLEIQLTPAEKVLALHREPLEVPRASIRSVTITDDPWIWIRGIRAPGALVPLVLAIGTWKFHGGKDFLIVKNKRQAVIIDIAGEEYARLVVSTNHAADLVDTLSVGASVTPAAKPRRKAKAKPAPETDAERSEPVAPATAPETAPATGPATGPETAAAPEAKPKVAPKPRRAAKPAVVAPETA